LVHAHSFGGLIRLASASRQTAGGAALQAAPLLVNALVRARYRLSLRPNQYNRRVLLAVSGLSPQVVTETVYGLAVSASEADRFIPTEIEVVTTTTGAERLRRSLFDSGEGILAGTLPGLRTWLSEI
jgi:hypothetical protein